ncbi:purine-cytosine permease family protein [Pelotomaculum propionicicum]|uniref:Cytosine permease n=1 Tax=Pelotomaculum propionicicum TaxID=258475 RepID=A0A4Y7RVL0_9FIRM|nr:cytosine permease [Pelotomaculum propionicicum]NLI13829.1 cytosine permease [Peptococcaceae bacterium]TEB12790.1 Cytosine permease [Pelotomaculum propionicicum]
MEIEQHGLDPVPETERTATWADLFIIWGDINLCLPSFVVGALLIPALSWGEAVSVNFWGNLVVGVLIVLGGYFGTNTGYPAVIYGRKVFGYPVGQWFSTALLLVSTLGWYAVMTAMTGEALDMIIKEFTGFSSPILMIILVGILNSSTAVMGYQRIRWLDWVCTPLLSLLCVWLTFKVLGLITLPVAFQYHPTGSIGYAQGMDLVIGGFISGAFVASDFSRYARSNRDSWFGTFPGAFLVSFLLGLLGMMSVVATGDWNPVTVVQDLGMGIPALFFILMANWTTNHSVLYSSGLALTNMLPRHARWKNTFICGVAGIVLAVAGLTDVLQSWLMLLSCVFSPLIGVVLTDFLIIKRTAGHTSVNVQAVIAVGAGIFLAKMTPPQYIASAVGLVSSSLIYIILKSPASEKQTGQRKNHPIG